MVAGAEVFVTEAETKLGERGEVGDSVARELIAEGIENLLRRARRGAAGMALEDASVCEKEVEPQSRPGPWWCDSGVCGHCLRRPSEQPFQGALS